MVDFTGLKVIHNLETASKAEREQYKQDVSSYLRLPKGGNWLDYIWIPDEITGFKKLVLYARRGTTDVLRELHGINVTDVLMLHIDDGKVIFKALGHNPEGRKEAAIGSHSLEGLKGERLAAAIATAETRAGRRLTLKFLGLGVLDASEVNMDFHLDTTQASVAQLSSTAPFLPPAPAFPLPQTNVAPIVATNIAPIVTAPVPPMPTGTITVTGSNGFTATVPPEQFVVVDNTPDNPMLPSGAVMVPTEPKKRKPRAKRNTVSLDAKVSDAPQPAPTGEGGSVGTGQFRSLPLTEMPSQNPEGPVVQPLETQEQFMARMQKLYTDAQATLVARQPNAAVPIQVSPVVPPQVNSAPVPSAANVEKLLREQFPAEPKTGTPVLNLGTPPPQAPIQFPPPQQSAAPDFPGKPTPEQQTKYRDMLAKYSSAILPQAGMMPSEGVGGPSAKLREYGKRMVGKDVPFWTHQEWEEFFNQMETFRVTNGDKALVKYINDVLGVK